MRLKGVEEIVEQIGAEPERSWEPIGGEDEPGGEEFSWARW